MPFASLSWFSLTVTQSREAKSESGDLLANDAKRNLTSHSKSAAGSTMRL